MYQPVTVSTQVKHPLSLGTTWNLTQEPALLRNKTMCAHGFRCSLFKERVCYVNSRICDTRSDPCSSCCFSFLLSASRDAPWTGWTCSASVWKHCQLVSGITGISDGRRQDLNYVSALCWSVVGIHGPLDLPNNFSLSGWLSIHRI